MSEEPRRPSWLRAVAEAARGEGFGLPPFTGHAMGGARSASVAGGRFITIRRRLVPAAQADREGVEWTLWLEQDGQPTPVAAFREPQEPTRDAVVGTLALLRGWLIDGWTPEETQAAVRAHPRARPVHELVPPDEDPSAE